MDPTKDDFVKYYAPWCKHCEKLDPIWEQLGKKYAFEKNLIIGNFDCTTEKEKVPGLDITRYPTLMFYPKGHKYGIKFEGRRDV